MKNICGYGFRRFPRYELHLSRSRVVDAKSRKVSNYSVSSFKAEVLDLGEFYFLPLNRVGGNKSK